MPQAPRFDARWNRRRRRARSWRGLRWWVLLALLLGAGWLARHYGLAGATWDRMASTFTICGSGGSAACVIDGDTIAIEHRRIRLTGYDAPELDGACEAERRRALEARDALAAWLNRGAFELDGGAEPPHDRYGRELRAARRGEEALADRMVTSGLARASTLDRGWC